MRVSKGYSFDTLLSKIKYFFLIVEALIMDMAALLEFVYTNFDSDIVVESCSYKHMKGPSNGAQKVVHFLLYVPRL